MARCWSHVHVHPAAAETFSDPLPPAAVALAVAGVKVNVHGAATWLTVKVCPAIVSVPERVDCAALAATV